MKEKQYRNKFNKDFKNSSHQKQTEKGRKERMLSLQGAKSPRTQSRFGENECAKLWETCSCILSFKGFLRYQTCWQGRRGILTTAYLPFGTMTLLLQGILVGAHPKVNSRGQPVLNNDDTSQAPGSLRMWWPGIRIKCSCCCCCC